MDNYLNSGRATSTNILSCLMVWRSLSMRVTHWSWKTGWTIEHGFASIFRSPHVWYNL
ncbi:hypothetical protein DVH24_016336 [Malus domestica]|uniref:Uncharacterized protein n=1 Tax=Malus domestica TaxID=3750 RepID=A0A498HTC8_MALDO|nr:hypothetical protein DVH24_016336 [Malus domestica]